MNLRLTIIFLFLTLCSFSQTSSPLIKADTLVQDLDIDSSLYLLSINEHQNDPAIKFRKEFLEILLGDGNDEEIIQSIEQHIDKYKNEPFSDIIRVNYLCHFAEQLIPDDSRNDYTLKVVNKALDLYQKSEVKDSFLLMHLLHNKGNLLHELQRHLEAIPALENALEIAQKIETRNESLVGIIYFNLANPLYSSQQYHKSYEYSEKSAEELSKVKNPNLDYYQMVYLDLFATSLEFGNLEKAEHYLKKSERIFEDNEVALTGGSEEAKRRREISLKYNRMMLYNHTLDVQNALTLLKSADKYRKYNDDHTRLRLAAIYNYMGELYVINEPIKSFRYYRKAMEIFDQPEDLKYGLMFQFNLGKAYLNSKNYLKAHETAQDLIKKGESIQDYRLPFFYFLEAKALLENNNFQASLQPLESMANSLNKSSEPINLMEQAGLAGFKPTEDLNDGYLLVAAAQTIEMHIQPSLETNLVMNSLYNLAIINFRTNYLRTKLTGKSREEYEKMLDGLITTDQYLNIESMSIAEMMKFSENASSRSLWEEFKFKHEGLNLIDEAIVSEEQQLRSELTALKLNVDEKDSTEVATLVFEKELALEEIELTKRQRHISFYKFEEFDFDFNQFQSKLGDDQQVIKFEFLDSILYRFEVTHKTTKVEALDSIEQVTNLVAEYLDLLRKPGSDVSLLKEKGEKLSRRLLPIDLKDNLIFISDQILNYLPFDLLIREGSYLISSHAISNATSLALMNTNTGSNEVTSTLVMAPSYDSYMLNDQQLAVRGSAYNLEGALAEADAISEIVNAKRYLRSKASKSTFFEKASSFDLLHLSMHSFINDEDPELSSLVFHDDINDNELFISELYGMNLTAKLAVLSACNTGVGREKTGEGMVSVNRAFTYAGVPAVVSSLWSAPDNATKEIMIEFYKNLKAGKNKAKALSDAKKFYLEHQKIKELKHPFFWGGFVVHGNIEPLEFTAWPMQAKIIVFILVLVLLIAILFWLRSKRE